jgi:hypothetical protein
MRKSLSVLLSALLATFGSAGCATVSTEAIPVRAAERHVAGALNVVILDRSDDAEPSALEVHSELARREGELYVKVHESDRSIWTLEDVPPGAYRFGVTRWVDRDGKAHSSRRWREFNLSQGEGIELRAVLQDRYPITALVIGSLFGAGVVALLVSLLPGGHLLSSRSTRPVAVPARRR